MKESLPLCDHNDNDVGKWHHSKLTLYSVILFPEEIKIEKYQDLMIFIISPSVELHLRVMLCMYMII